MTRFYRAPEIILGSTEYSHQIDNWSLGCILGEIIHFSDFYGLRDKLPVFRGDSCFPLSPCKEMSQSSDQSLPIVHKMDQLLVILRLLGHQSSSDISFLPPNGAKEYMFSIQKTRFSNSLQSHFSKAPRQLLDMLCGLLSFNPDKRLTPQDCLKSSYFDEIRVPELENATIPEIKLPIENLDENMSREQLK